MNIKQALKHKKKLASKINQEFVKLSTYNSVEAGSNRIYDPKQTMQNWLKMNEELIELKTKIHRANAPVYGKIFKMSELKSQITFLKQLDCTEGKYTERYRMSETPLIKETVIGRLERDHMILSMEEEIEKIQEELDYHNANTFI